MKYIRTKDNAIHKVIESFKPFYETIDESVKFLYVYPNPSDGTEIYADSGYHRHEIVKEADCIEKLCDFCVILQGTHITHAFPADDLFQLHLGGYEGEGYLAVETERGLIYVAKKNEKGEWKLL